MAGSRLAARLRRPGRIPPDPFLTAALVTGLGAVAVIRTTMLPSVGSWDTAEAQVVPPLLGTMHPTGSPAFVVLGWLVSILLHPFARPAFLMNLMAALLVGVAVAGCVLVTRRLGVPLIVAVAVAAGFALTPIVWSIGNAADVHALHLALVVLVVLGLLRWESLVAARRSHPAEPGLGRRADRAIVLTAGVFGVAVANHALALLLIPPIGLYVLSVEPRVLVRPRLVISAVAACIGAAALLYLELPLRAGLLRAPLVYGHPDTWNGFWEILLARQFQGDIVSPLADLGGKATALTDLAFTQLGPLAALIPVGLAVTIVRFPRYALLSAGSMLIVCLFAASYVNAQIDRYYLGPAFFAWTWIAVFAGTVVEGMAARGEPDVRDRDGTAAGGVPVPEPAAIYVPAWRHPRTVLAIGLGIALLLPTGLALATRWRSLDRSQETWVDDWLNQAFAAMAPNAVVVSWWSYSTPLWYGQLVEGRRPDIWIVDDRTRLDQNLGDVTSVIDANLGTRPVYVIRLQESDIQTLAIRYKIESVGHPGNLYRVTGRLETAP